MQAAGEGSLNGIQPSLRDRLEVITGAGSGICLAVATQLATEGARLCLIGRELDKLNDVAQVARHDSPEVACFSVDLSQNSAIREFVTAFEQTFGHADVLVHSAAEIFLAPLSQADVRDFDRLYEVNLRAPFRLTQLFVPLLTERCGQVVFINSSAGVAAGPRNGLYSATKHGLKAIADSFRQELDHRGVRVISVYPGRTATVMQQTVCNAEREEYRPDELLQPENIASLVVQALKMPGNVHVTNVYMQARPSTP